MSEILLAPVSLIAGFFVALSVIPCSLGVYHLVSRKEGYLPFLFFASTFVNVIMVLDHGRSLFTSEETTDLTAEAPDAMNPSTWIVWLARLNMALFTYAVCQRLARVVFQSESNPNTPYALIFAFILFNCTNVLAPSFFGAHPAFDHGYLYLLMAGLAALFFLPGEDVVCIKAVRDAFLMFLIFGLLLIPWKPDFVFSNNYIEGVIPGLTYRYAGAAMHANQLGIYLVLFMQCLWSKPYSNRILNALAWAVAFVCLVLAQSKTCWIGTLLTLSFLGYFHYGPLLKQRLFDFRKPVLPALVISTVMIAVLAISSVVMFSSLGNKVDAFFSSRAGSDLMTMTGRNVIWAVALEEWHHSPIFGYGLTLWDASHRAKIGLPMATSAHNQFYETLASAGTIGAIGLVTYVLVLFWHSYKTMHSSQGLTMAIFLSLFVRSASESSLPVINHFGPDGMTHVLLLMIIGAQYTSNVLVSVPLTSVIPKYPFSFVYEKPTLLNRYSRNQAVQKKIRRNVHLNKI